MMLFLNTTMGSGQKAVDVEEEFTHRNGLCVLFFFIVFFLSGLEYGK